MTVRDHGFVGPSTPPSSRLVPGLPVSSARRQTWIPAFAGMTVEGVSRRQVGVVSDMGGGVCGNGRRRPPARCGSTPPSSLPVPGLSASFAGRQTWIPA
ncbi:hypothetical protein, partial [Tistrella mobilis]|uniref:hypothetical protein n=1 Tax=Tistrella mobilis TaxID=171437 RepID=UPI000AF60D07